MKHFITFYILTLIIPILSFGQQSENLANYQYLIKDSLTLNQIKKGEYPHPAVEIGINKPFKASESKSYPLKVAIDPGHIASNKKEAILEERYINTKNGFLYESEFTMATALLLKEKLEARNIEVMITRNIGETALGVSYLKWFKKDKRKDLTLALKRGEITDDQYQDLIKGDAKYVFDKYFRDKDFIERANKINAFKPDVVLIIHYNASEFKNSPNTFTPVVSTNYSVAFVPGGFTNSELIIESQLDDFVRLASTDILPKSILFSSFIINEFQNKLGSPSLLPNDNPNLWYLKKYSIYTNRPGVYSRNLFMTRAIASPVCYAECLLQNNEDEILRLSKKDLKVQSITTSSRIGEVADACYTGIVKYFIHLGYLN